MANSTTTLVAQIRSISINNCDPVSIKLPDITYEELVDLEKHNDRLGIQLPRSIEGEVADLEKAGYDSTTYNDPPFTYGSHAKYDNCRYSQAPRIDNVTIPPHLFDVIKRDVFDMGEREGRHTAAEMDGNYHSLFKGQYHELSDSYNNQNQGKGKVEAVLYRRKRKAEDLNETAGEGTEIDARGRMIQRTVWPSHRGAALSESSPTKRQRLSPTAVREAVFIRASEASPSSTQYQNYDSTPAPQEVEYRKTTLFRSGDRVFHNPAITKKTRNEELRTRRRELELEQERFRKQRGGLLIDLQNRMRLDLPHHIAGVVVVKYADAFEDWDEEMRNSPLKAFKGYAVDDDRRKWFMTMWEMPDKVERQVACANMYLQVDLGESAGEGWLHDLWESEPL